MTDLVSDIGGTSVRFALTLGQHGQHAQLVLSDSIRVYAVKDYASPADALQHYLDDVGPQRIERAVMAVATPIKGDFLDITNNHWAFSIRQLAQQFSIGKLLFVNDFTALAHSLPELTVDELRSIGGPPLLETGPKALIGPGTGLGVSGLIPNSTGGWTALQGEGGHTTVSATTEREFALLNQLSKQFGHVSAERILSGPGIEWTYEALCALDGVTSESFSAEQITRHGVAATEQHCTETLEIFFHRLGQRAGDLALTLGATGGVYVGGGIVPKLGQAIDDSCFRSSFEAKGRMGTWLKKMPTVLITAEFAALKGAAVLLATA